MFGAKSLSRLFAAREAAQPSIPEGVVAYAIGDIHGRADLLLRLLEAVLGDTIAKGRTRQLICVGDYIDRGPDSRAVLDMLIELQRHRELETHFLFGNHDQTLLDFLADPSGGVDWCEYGGRETLASYGVSPPLGRMEPEQWQAVREALADAIPQEHLKFLRGLDLTYELGDYFFAHAGARPGVALNAQVRQDLLWIRQPFLNDIRAFEKIVVHGHTPAEDAYVDHRRIGLDTGAYATGVLSALRLEGRDRRLVQARRQTDGRIKIEFENL